MDTKLKIISSMIHEFINVMSREEMIKKYKWFSLASGIHDDELTLKLIKQTFKENTYQHRI
ncbi:hypothetical protein ACQPUZ_04680 [Clostridium tertium]